MKLFFLIPLLSFFLLSVGKTFAQIDTTKQKNEEEEAGEPTNFSQFQGEVEEATGVKRYCTSKVFGITPNKLISIGYDYQLAYKMTSEQETQSINATHGLRVLANFPVISTNKITFNIGANYTESNYNFPNPEKLKSPLHNSLHNNPLRSTGLAFTVFKPLNEKHFLLFNTQHEMSGDYRLDEWQKLNSIRHSVAGVFGWKKHDRLMYGFGVARTYRVGEMNYIPVILCNYTSGNRKWGIEAFFPARLHFRRSFNTRNLLLFGYELEGTSYQLRNKNNEFNTLIANPKSIELRRSELRFRAVFEKQLHNFIWLSFQAGYRVGYNFQVDNGDFFRGFFGNQPYLIQSSITNPLYFNFSINLVSP